MTANTITIPRLLDLAAALEIAAQSVARLAIATDSGGVTTAEAAAEVAETMATLAKASE